MPLRTVLCSLLAALCVTLHAAPAVAVALRPALKLADCRLDGHGAPSVAARCGVLVVPEDYAQPAGPTLMLRVAVVPSLGPGAEPLFVLAGGPGQAATDFYAAVAPAFALVARTHDIILVDQRGTGGSSRLDCAFPNDFSARTPPPAEIERLSGACVAGLKVRPQFYTTSVAVRDLDAVRAALGYQALSLYGASYGTRVAQHYLRRYPDRVQALILDGVVPPQAVLGPAIADDAQRALDLDFSRCAANAACHGAFPDPAADLRTLRERLGAAPLTLTLPDPATAQARSVGFGSEELGSTLRLLSYSASTAALIPLLLHTAAGGDVRPLAAQFVLYSKQLDEQIAYGMHNAVTCTEDAPYFGPIDRARMQHTYLGTGEFDALVAMCRPWPRGVRDTDLSTPLAGRAPALLLSGEADPVTPPAYGEQAATGFADARHLILAGQGHGQLGTGCMPEVMARFLKDHRARALDARCIDKVTAPAFFIDYAGPSP